MNVDVVLLPALIPQTPNLDATIVVFDVLRATTTITAALSAGVAEIGVYGDTQLAREAAATCGPLKPLLCGEERCVVPAGFDLGNSPAAFEPRLHRGRSVYLSTTNGMRAILAARGHQRILCGALVNAGAVARLLQQSGATDVLLLCAGTNGEIATEDVIGAGAVMHALHPHTPVRPRSDVASLAEDLFAFHRSDLAGTLRNTRGGRNVIAAGLEPDIDFAARLDAIDAVGEVHAASDREAPVIRTV